ncbi:VOC family protein [Paenibacillus marinisediminis]
MTPMFKRIDTVFVYVSDLERSVQWYTNILGLQVRWNMQEYAILSVADGETPLTLMQSTEEQLIIPTGEQFNFFTPDIDKAYVHLSEQGVSVGEMNVDGGVKFFTFKDPDGNVLGACYFE